MNEQEVRKILLKYRQGIVDSNNPENMVGQLTLDQALASLKSLNPDWWDADANVIKADEVTLAFFRKYLEMPKATLEELCREIERLKSLEPKVEEIYKVVKPYIGNIDDRQKVAEAIVNHLKGKE